MRILLIHNTYKQAGGEDAVFENERTLLEKHSHAVKTLYFDNKNIDTFGKKVKLSYQLFFNRDSERIVDDLIEEFRPDIIHVHNFFYLASPSIFYAADRYRIPVVVTLHNYRLICSGSLLMRDDKPCELCVQKIFPTAGIRYACHRNSRVETTQLTLTTGLHKILDTWNKKVTLYIALTDFARRKFIHSSLRLNPGNVIVKPNSVDDTSPVGSKERGNHFLFIGRLSNEKGIEVILKAFRNRSTVIEIIGDGPLLDKVVEATTGNKNIKYLGYQDKSVIFEKLKQCKALIVPSICYENLPITILEAYATGTPVIVSDIQNLNEIVIDNYNGVHFKTNDPEDLYSKVQAFTDHRQNNEALHLNARKTFLQKYSHELNYKNLINIYQRAVCKNEASGPKRTNF